MAVGIGASGFLGIAREAVGFPNVYVAPEKYILIRSEGLQYVQDTTWTRPLRGIADPYHAVPGNVRVEGDISFEVTSDQLPWLLFGAHGTMTKTTGTAPFTYTYVPNATATPSSTLSITVVRNGVAFGYVGCVISSMEFSIDDGILVCSMSILGTDEASQTVPTPTYPEASPFGAGMYSMQIPTATQVFDCDSFTLSVEDGAEPQYRLQSGGARGARFIKFGERSITLSVERDFENRTEYDNYKALTRRSITLQAVKNATNDSVTFKTPAAIMDSYEIPGLSGQGDLIRASVSYMGVFDPSGGVQRALEIVIKTNEDITA